MRSLILIFAIISLAQGCGMSAIGSLGFLLVPINPFEFYKGLSEKLGFSAELNQQLKTCMSTIVSTFNNSDFCPPKKTLEENIIWFAEQSSTEKTAFLKQMKEKLVDPSAPVCAEYFKAVHVQLTKAGIVQNGRFLGLNARQNFRKHHAIILSEVAGFLDKIYRNSTAIGQDVGHILQILAGVVTPATPNFNHSFTPVKPENFDVYIQSLINSLHKELGSNSQMTIEEAKVIKVAIEGLLKDVVLFNMKFYLNNNPLNKLFASTEYVASILRAKNALQFVMKKHPNFHLSERAVFGIVYNLFKNLPAIEVDFNQFISEAYTNHPEEAGKTLAHIVKTIEGERTH